MNVQFFKYVRHTDVESHERNGWAFHGCIWRSLDDVSNTFRALGVPVKGELQ